MIPYIHSLTVVAAEKGDLRQPDSATTTAHVLDLCCKFLPELIFSQAGSERDLGHLCAYMLRRCQGLRMIRVAVAFGPFQHFTALPCLP